MILKQIAEISAGQGAPQGDSNYCSDGTPFVKAGNLFDLINGLSIHDIQKVSDDVANKHKLKKYKKGSIVFAKSGMSCLKGYVYVLPCDAYVVSHLAIITPYENIEEYLKYYFIYYKPNSLIKDAAYPSISLNDIGNMQIDVKTEVERRKIVSSLDTATHTIDLCNAILEKLDLLVKSRFVEMFGDLMYNPNKWSVYRISDVSTFLKSGLSRKLSDQDIGMPCIRSCNIQNGQFDYSDIKYWYIDDPQGANTNDYILKDGDILINFINSNSQIGKVCIFSDVNRDCIYTTNIFRMILNEKCNKHYFNYYAMTEYYKRQLQNIIQPAVNQSSFTTVNFLKLSIPVPPIELQNQFAVFVEQTDKSKSAVKKLLEKAETLKKALMQEYFG